MKGWASLVVEAGVALWDAYQERRRKQSAADAYANAPAPVRGCPRCKAIAYTPGQVLCSSCGERL